MVMQYFVHNLEDCQSGRVVHNRTEITEVVHYSFISSSVEFWTSAGLRTDIRAGFVGVPKQEVS